MATSRTLPSPKLLRNLSLGAIAALLAFGLIAQIRENFAMERQELKIDPQKAQFVKKFPNHFENTSARVLRERAAKLGIAVESPFAMQSPLNRSEKQSFSQIEKSLARDLTAQIASENPRFAPLSPELERYLKVRDRELTRLQNALRFHSRPDWGRENNWLENANVKAMPDFVGLTHLHNLLLADAIAQYQQGRAKRSLENLDAAWTLSESLKSRPEVKSQLTYFKLVRTHLAILRRVDNVPSHWQQRLLQRNYRTALQGALENEAWFQYTAVEQFRSYRPEKLAPILSPQEIQELKGGGMQARYALRHRAIERYQSLHKLSEALPQANLCVLKNGSDLAEQPANLSFGKWETLPPTTQQALEELMHLELETRWTQETIAAEASATQRSSLQPNPCTATNG